MRTRIAAFPVSMLLGALVVATTGTVRAEVKVDKAGKVKLQADLRLRFESDWDSKRSDGTKRSDRDRLRARYRLGLAFDSSESLSLGFRLRSGSRGSQQSPHVTLADFDDNPTGDKDFLFDKWYVRASGKGAWAWLGRNSLPFWKQNELFWDDDVTPAGVAGGYERPVQGGSVALNAAYLVLPDGGVDFAGDMAAGQAVVRQSRGPWQFTAAGGLFKIFGARRSEHLRNGNGTRDYTIWTGGVQLAYSGKALPLKVGLDLLHNSEDYSDVSQSDPFAVANQDQDNGFVVALTAGDTAQKGHWLLAYYYARIETLAVNASYAQDDWVRWGSATQTDSSDFKGHEIRGAYAFSEQWNLVARIYFVEAITSVQDGKRFRLDLNYRF